MNQLSEPLYYSLGRSSAPDSFTLWTAGLNSTAFHPAFVPEGAPAGYNEGEPALVVGSGVRVKQLYEAADRAKVIVAGGVSASVGAAGGFVLGGGHGEYVVDRPFPPAN